MILFDEFYYACIILLQVSFLRKLNLIYSLHHIFNENQLLINYTKTNFSFIELKLVNRKSSSIFNNEAYIVLDR